MEWIIANSKGGYALGNYNLIPTRKYHGILIAGKGPKRIHLVGSIEEKVKIEKKNEEGENEFFLDSNNYKDVIYPDGYNRLVRFFPRPYPIFIFSTYPPRKNFFITKKIMMHKAKNISLIEYKNESDFKIKMFLRPKFTLRWHHRVNPPGFWDNEKWERRIFGNVCIVRGGEGECFTLTTKGKIYSEPVIFRNVYYTDEILRGYEGVEDLLAPFLIEVDLEEREKFFLIFGDEPLEEEIKEEIFERYKNYPLPSDLKYFEEKKEIKFPRDEDFSLEEYKEILSLCLEEFLLEDGNLIAGYPWFSSWGRDALISLPAFPDEIKKSILSTYAQKIKNGLIPNFFGEDGTISYDSVDTSLWFALRVLEYKMKEFYDKVLEIIKNYIYSPPLPFRISDGMIEILECGKALTWMDATWMGEPITPRYGKPIEVNALWFNVLKLAVMEKWMIESEMIKDIKKILGDIKKEFRKFFNEDFGFADRIERGNPIFEIRPNFVIALSLPYTPFGKREIEIGYKIAKEKLLTQYGLRTLNIEHPAFKMVYIGNQRMRDMAYHQGTVWCWLLLPMALLCKKIFKREKLISELEGLVSKIRYDIRNGILASVPEIYDGYEPTKPRGAISQLWSVSALYIIEKMIEEEKIKKDKKQVKEKKVKSKVKEKK